MSLPDINIPKVALNVLTIITVSAMMMTGQVYSTKTFGLTSMPTETKNIAAKRFFIGVTSLWMMSASSVSARMEPITNAPRADEKPA